MSIRATRAIVDLAAIRHNLGLVRRRLPSGCRILLVVKANAYGLGAVNVAKAAERNGVYYLGVAALSEAVELRRAGVSLPILMFTEGFLEEYAELLRANVTQTVFSFEKAREIDVVAGALGRTSTIHLKVDTGMGRVGCRYGEAASIAKAVKRELRYTFLEGIYTHFPVAEEPRSGDNRNFTLSQIAMMRELKAALEGEGVHVPIYHCANTGAVLNFPEAAFDMVRVGISAYGCHPSDQGERLPLKNVLSFRTRVIFVKRVPKGTSISYGREYVTDRETTIATLPVGYADGYPLALSNRGVVLINGRRYNIAGRVCMDQCMVDVGDDPVSVGDEVELYGEQQGERFTVEDAARMLGTIPYELMCRIAPRVPRIHVGLEGIDVG